jgi:hypothetical protein
MSVGSSGNAKLQVVFPVLPEVYSWNMELWLIGMLITHYLTSLNDDGTGLFGEYPVFQDNALLVLIWIWSYLINRKRGFVHLLSVAYANMDRKKSNIRHEVRANFLS